MLGSQGAAKGDAQIETMENYDLESDSSPGASDVESMARHVDFQLNQ